MSCDEWTAEQGWSVQTQKRISKYDILASKARDEANNRGADAWSPSRAREALRERVSRVVRTLGPGRLAGGWLALHDMAERTDAYRDQVAFNSFWFSNVDTQPPAL